MPVETLRDGDSLEWSVAEDITKDPTRLEILQQRLLQAIWGLEVPRTTHISSLTNHYLSEIGLIDPYEIPLARHHDVVEIVDFVRDRATKSRASIRTELIAAGHRWLGQSSTSADTAVNLAIKVWLLNDPFAFQADDCIILNRFAQQFPQAGQRATFEDLETKFEARFFEKVAGVTLIGTLRLENHLRYDRKQRVLWVFALSDFLSSSRSQEEQKLFPPGLLTETKKSLVLLYPRDRAHPADVVASQAGQGSGPTCSDQFLDLHDPNSYLYWRERLIILHGVYSTAQPSRLTQFWRDRRDTNQWTTLWLAVLVILLTLVFGLIQSVTGILQVIIAYRQSKPN